MYTSQFFSPANGKEFFSPADGDKKPILNEDQKQQLGQIGINVIGGFFTPNEVKTYCGTRPLFAGSKRDAWDTCSANVLKSKTPGAPAPTPQPDGKGGIGTMGWVGIGVGFLVLAGGVIYAIKH